MNYKTSLSVGMTPEGDSVGWASTYGNVDRVNETVDRGAFFAAPYVDLPTLAYHDPERPVATSNLTDEFHGLYDVTKFVPGDADADKIRNLVRHKAIPAMSIGYDIEEATIDNVGVTHLVKVDLMEVSFVPIPANPEARVIAAKAFGSYVTDALRQGMKSLFGEAPDRWTDAEEMVRSTKAGARNSMTDQQALDAAHDAIVTAGAKCAPSMEGKDWPSASELLAAEILMAELEALK